MLSRLSSSSNVPSLISVILSGSSTVFKLSLLANAYFPISVTDPGTIIVLY